MSEFEIDTLARTLWGEARGEGELGIEAVACVIANRVAIAEKGRGPRMFGTGTFESACRFPYQFSCWLPSDPNLEKLKSVTEDDRAFRVCMGIAEIAVSGNLEDITVSATHYHTKQIKPAWAAGKAPCATIGNHLFYRGV